ncbi:hypothetical protein PIB30_033577 [Stylosanthes scabra]|uniref:Serpin domain-containing protein n=1 Tax=Stylosanthes scabra TaxID=79078 RepID=A0ABU6XCP9_9FABA|nr:hypothetical protein [Stylosanthes scabra]
MRTRKRKALSDSSAASATNVSQEATAAQKMTPEFSIAKHLLLSKQTNGGYKNVVFSPLCIKLLLSIVAAGSSGPVRDQLLSFLRSESIDDLNSVATRLFSSVLVDSSLSGGPCLSFANGVWIDKSLSLKPSFSQVLENVYKPAFVSLDFTNKNIIMANALYFKGLWPPGDSFKKTKTVDGGSVKVPFMNRSPHVRATAIAHQGFKVLTLGYMNAIQTPSKMSPERSSRCTFFFPIIISTACRLWLKRMLPRGIKTLSALKIPRFKLSFMVDASPVLKEMGLVLPFMEGALTEMVEGRDNAHVSEIIQKCIIEVNEEGTKASASGRLMIHTMAGRGVKKEPLMEFIADHPFLFLIREQITGTTLFIGQVLNPLHA